MRWGRAQGALGAGPRSAAGEPEDSGQGGGADHKEQGDLEPDPDGQSDEQHGRGDDRRGPANSNDRVKHSQFFPAMK